MCVDLLYIYNNCALFLMFQESGVGKTCIVNRFVSDVFSDKEPLTVGLVDIADPLSKCQITHLWFPYYCTKK